jgi:hypothetical protein
MLHAGVADATDGLKHLFVCETGVLHTLFFELRIYAYKNLPSPSSLSPPASFAGFANLIHTIV